MLVKRARVGPSVIHRWGLFATEPIGVGEVCDESPIIITPKVPPELADHVYSLPDGRYGLPCGDGIFANHSGAPNVEARVDLRRRIIGLVALHPVRAAEELTIDYSVPLARGLTRRSRRARL